MTGDEHYREAERLLDSLPDVMVKGLISVADLGNGLAAAQVHATLALAAAAQYPDGDGYGG